MWAITDLSICEVVNRFFRGRGCIHAAMILFQQHLMHFKSISKLVSWRGLSYIIGGLTAAYGIAVFHFHKKFHVWMGYLAPLHLSHASVCLVLIINLVAIFWLYGSYNFLNDVCVRDHKTKVRQ